MVFHRVQAKEVQLQLPDKKQRQLELQGEISFPDVMGK